MDDLLTLLTFLNLGFSSVFECFRGTMLVFILNLTNSGLGHTYFGFKSKYRDEYLKHSAVTDRDTGSGIASHP